MPKELPNMCALLLGFFSLLPLSILVANSFHPSADAFIRRPNMGLMKLCPPGGESFAAAWEITCGMKRKRRSIPATNDDEKSGNRNEKMQTNGERRAMTTEIDDIASGKLLFNKEVLAQPIKRRGMEGEGEGEGEKGKKEEYRPPSMTEMMLFCCRFGCSLRDLMPYCDPFGQWDS